MSAGAPLTADDIRLDQTCGACPEQYDAYDPDGKQVAYLRLRHGYFTVDMPDAGGTEVYSARPLGDGVFDPDEREDYLHEASQVIAEHLNAVRAPVPMVLARGLAVSTMSDILDEAEVERLLAERESLRIQRDAVAARMDEIDRALFTSGEARLRERRKALAAIPAREMLDRDLDLARTLGLLEGGL